MTPIAAMALVLESRHLAQCVELDAGCFVIRDGKVILGRAGTAARAWRDAALRLPSRSMRDAYLMSLVRKADSFGSLKDALLREVILATVRACKGNQSAAADVLGIHRNTVARNLRLKKGAFYGNENGYHVGGLDMGTDPGLQSNDRHHRREKGIGPAMSILLRSEGSVPPASLRTRKGVRRVDGDSGRGAALDWAS